MAADPYELDQDVASLRRRASSSAIPTKKNSLYGKNPQLKAEEEYDYEKDQDVASLLGRKQKPIEQIDSGLLPSWLAGGIEATMGAISGMATPVVGGAYGIAKSIPEAIRTGQAPAPIAQRYAEQFIKQHPGYVPQIEQGQEYLGKIGEVFDAAHLAAVMPEALHPNLGGATLSEARIGATQAAKAALNERNLAKIPSVRIERSPAEMQLQQQFSNQQGLQNAGAAVAIPENVLQGNIDAALANASPALQAHVSEHPIEHINIPALETRALEEKHGVHLTTGQRTGDTTRYAQEWNKRGETQDLTEHFKSQPLQMAEAVEAVKQRHAPDIPSSADASELGQHEINALSSKDKIRTEAISNAYKALKDENGGQFPIDITTLNSNIRNSLSSNLKTNHLSPSIASDLGDFYKNPTFEAYEALRTNLANEMRSSSNGNARSAAYIVRDELEKLPIFGEGTGSPQAIRLKELADNARGLVRERSAIIKSNPAYRAAIKEAADAAEASSQGEALNAAKFHNKFVSSATPEAIRRMKSEISEGDLAHQAIAHGELERVRNAITNANATRVKSDSFSDFLKKNTPVLREALPPEALQDVAEIGLLNSKIGKPDAGTFNHSNTFSSALASMAKEGLSNAAETKLALLTKGASIPVVGGAKMFWQQHNKGAFAKEAMNPHGGLIKENQLPRIEISGVPGNKEK